MTRLIQVTLYMLATLFISPAALAQDTPQFELLSGIPVMEGLTEDLDHRVVFDKVEGRIIRTLLVGDISLASATSFYREVLFQLGWVAENDGEDVTFVRDGEHLTLVFSDAKPLKVTISLKPLS